MKLAIGSLCFAIFCIGTTEFMVTGLLAEIASDLSISIPAAGFLITGYALGVAIGGPVVSMLTWRFEHKTTMLALMAVFVAGHAIGALAYDYLTLMFARIVVSLTHGTLVGLALIIAASITSPGSRGMGISTVIAGFTIANIFGSPGGAALGQMYGWRSTFWAVAILGAVVLLLLGRFLPGEPQRVHQRPSLGAQLRVLASPQISISFALIILTMFGLFSTYTYIDPFLVEVAGYAPDQVAWVLLAFGFGSWLGVLLGGRLADRASALALAVCFPVQGLLFFGLHAFGGNRAAAALLLTMLGTAGFVAGVLLQVRILHYAEKAPNLASSLISSAFNVAIALGATAGALSLDLGLGYQQLPLVGTITALIGTSLTLWKLRS